MPDGVDILRESRARLGERLHQRLARGALDRDEIERAASAFAQKHRSLPRPPHQAAETAPERISQEIDDLFTRHGDEIARLLSDAERAALRDRLQEFPLRFRDRFEGRWKRGLCAEPRSPIPLEAIHLEPNGDIRIAPGPDPLSSERGHDLCNELVAIALHLTRDGRGDLAEAFLASYARATDDYDLYGVIDFYEAVRAFESALRVVDRARNQSLAASERMHLRERARRLLLVALAKHRTPLVPPQVIAMAGHVACGKSTVARHIGGEIGAPAVVADLVRVAVLEAPLDEDVPEAVWKLQAGSDLYEAVYSELFRRSEVVLASGRPVVIDACFPTAGMRERARNLAVKYGAPFLFVECSAPRDVVDERLLARARRDGVEPAVWRDIARGYDEQAEQPDELEADEFIEVDTSLELDENARRLHPRIVAGHRVPPAERRAREPRE